MIIFSFYFNTIFTGNFTCLEVIFVLKRRLGYYLFHTYIPTCLIVIMSVSRRTSYFAISIILNYLDHSKIETSVTMSPRTLLVDTWLIYEIFHDRDEKKNTIILWIRLFFFFILETSRLKCDYKSKLHFVSTFIKLSILYFPLVFFSFTVILPTSY